MREPYPEEVEALLERRRHLGLDTFDELLIIEPDDRAIHWLALRAGGYVPIERSTVIGLGPAELPSLLGWS